ncbi:hypothetical protein B0H11DRAFT_1925170 [Mycena galericulata]|nr:hypothetical protein B0H11DRAFT_1925170 [Mycena galericulata]
MCTHALAPLAIDTILLKSRQSFVCTPYRYVPRVPQEIIDAIVDNVEDMSSLKACSLVCWAFVPASRTRIFRTICIDMLSNHAHNLHAVLLRNPDLALYVRDVTIYRSHHTPLWMPSGSPLPAVLNMLTQIQRFSLFACWGDWRDVPAPLAAALTKISRLPALDRLHILTASNLPAALLNNALSLRVLSLFHCSLDPRKNPRALRKKRTALCTAPGLEYLNLSLDSKVGKILEHSRTRFGTIRCLALNPIPNSPNSAVNLAKVLSAVEGTLERLDVQMHEHHAHPIHTARLARLRTLELHVILQTPRNTVPAFLPSAIADLREANPKLSTLRVVLHVPWSGEDDSSGVVESDDDHSHAADGDFKREPHTAAAGDVAVEADAPHTPPVPGAHAAARRLRAIDDTLSTWCALREFVVEVVPEGSPPAVLPDYVGFVRACLGATRARMRMVAPRAPTTTWGGAQGGGVQEMEDSGRLAGGEKGILEIRQGYRVLGASVMPLLPYTSVWPHRPKKSS